MLLEGTEIGGWDEGEKSVRCGGYRILGPLCLLGCSSVVVGEGACVRGCQGLGWTGVILELV
jgi:hypothetical protein